MSSSPPPDLSGRRAEFALVAVAAFGLYFLSAFILDARSATTHFGADSWYYTELAKGSIFERAMSDYYLDRVARFHPVTVIMAAGWMQILAPLSEWIPEKYLLKAMFAAVGAVGVWAALWGFAAVLPRRLVVLFGLIYAASLGVWYFSSIEESKIVTATLSTLYIAAYLHLRRYWTVKGAAVLTTILLIACLNEMVSGLLIVIPAVDTLMKHGWDWRQGRWLAAHALAGPLAFVLIEGVMFGWLVATSHPEGSSHFGMLLYYVGRNYYSLGTFYAFLLNWVFFNIAAPAREASYAVPAFADYKGYFEPSVATYFASTLSIGLVVLFAVFVWASVRARASDEELPPTAGLVPAFFALSFLRAAFFLLFNPAEPLLFSPAVTLPHLMLLAIPLAAAELPAKRVLLAAFAVLLFIRNWLFIVGP